MDGNKIENDRSKQKKNNEIGISYFFVRKRRWKAEAQEETRIQTYARVCCTLHEHIAESNQS